MKTSIPGIMFILLASSCNESSIIAVSSTIQSPATPNWNQLKKASCNTEGLLWNNEDAGSNSSLYPNSTYAAVAASPCYRLARAVETWASVPNLSRVKSNIKNLYNLNGNKPLVLGAFLAEAINYTDTFFTASGSTITGNSSWCQTNFNLSINQWAPNTCVPDLSNANYKAHLFYLVQQLINLGITDFQFGELGLLDPTQTLMVGEHGIIAQIKKMAPQGTTIIVGGQPNRLYDAAYLKSFDYIDGPIHLDAMGDFTPTPNQPQWEAISPFVWYSGFAQSGVNIFTEIDWSSAFDDVHYFSSLLPQRRWDVAYNIYQFMKAHGMGFTFPFSSIPMNGDLTTPHTSICYGKDALGFAGYWAMTPPVPVTQGNVNCGALLGGVTTGDAQVWAEIMSEEYIPASSSDQQLHWLQQTYKNLFGRAIDSSGAQYWQSQLTAGQSQDQVYNALQASPEAYQAAIAGIAAFGITNTNSPFSLQMGGSILLPGNSGPYMLAMQAGTGNLFLYNGSSGAPLWNTSFVNANCENNSCYASFQSDGNLVVRDDTTPTFTAIWASGTGGNNPGSVEFVIQGQSPFLKLQDLMGDVLWAATSN